MTTRAELLSAAQSFCNDFASKQDVEVLLTHFSRDPVPSAIEHGLKFLTPFLGRTESVRKYVELIARHLTYQNMRFSEYVVDADVRKVAVKGEADFTWASTGEKWNETFLYMLDFNEQAKVVKYEVWGDTGAAYLARRGELHSQEETSS